MTQQPLETGIFQLAPRSYVKALTLRWLSRKWLWGVCVAVIPAAVWILSGDTRWLIAEALMLLVVLPQIVAFVYFSQVMSAELPFHLRPQQWVLSSDGSLMVRRWPEGTAESPSGEPTCHHFANPRFSISGDNLSVVVDDIQLFLAPLDAFPCREDVCFFVKDRESDDYIWSGPPR